MPSGLDGGEMDRVLVAYARRTLDAASAVALVCEAVARRGAAPAWCMLVGAPRGETIAGAVDAPSRDVAAQAFARAASGRFLARRGDDTSDLFARAKTDVVWVAIEPVSTRAGVHLGSLVAVGAHAACNDVLAALPRAALFCELIASELLSARLLEPRLHRFNNVLAVVSSTIEALAAELLAEPGALSSDQREALAVMARSGHDGARALVAAATDLHRLQAR